ncbi:hypothetical protein AC579_7457 [Pseudocercospora musae]|uniref:Uncharacterized protein n=1 Tax=Pseudocercospora musae TaxID=113226 RepID=A0A139H7M2_9PEZI|nr:hypothetical protein AC579_7457 [Pseudocercospora musae]
MSTVDPPRPLLHRKKSSSDLRRESNDVWEIIKAYGSSSSASSSTSSTKAAVEFWEKMVKEDDKYGKKAHRRTSHYLVSPIPDRDAVPGAAPDDEDKHQEPQQRQPIDLAVTQRRKTGIPSPIQSSGSSPRSSSLRMPRTANRPYSPSTKPSALSVSTKLLPKESEEEQPIAFSSDTAPTMSETFEVSFSHVLALSQVFPARLVVPILNAPSAYFHLAYINARQTPLFLDESIKEALESIRAFMIRYYLIIANFLNFAYHATINDFFEISHIIYHHISQVGATLTTAPWNTFILHLTTFLLLIIPMLLTTTWHDPPPTPPHLNLSFFCHPSKSLIPSPPSSSTTYLLPICPHILKIPHPDPDLSLSILWRRETESPRQDFFQNILPKYLDIIREGASGAGMEEMGRVVVESWEVVEWMEGMIG